MLYGISIILTILLIILAGIGYWFYSPVSNAEEFYGKSHDKGFVVESNNEEFKTVGEKGILQVNKEYYKNNKYFITSFNPTYLLLTRVSERGGDKDNLIYQYYLKRNFSGFEFLKYGKYLTTNKTFPEAIAIAQKYDLSKENPDPENIRVQTPPTKEQVAESKRLTELETNPDAIKEKEKCEDVFFGGKKTMEDKEILNRCFYRIENKEKLEIEKRRLEARPYEQKEADKCKNKLDQKKPDSDQVEYRDCMDQAYEKLKKEGYYK